MLTASQPRQRVQDYYVVRECPEEIGDYWAPRADPDGVMRNRDTDEERRQYIEDMADEIDFVNDVGGSVLDFGAGLGWFLDALTMPLRTAIESCPVARERLIKKYWVWHGLDFVDQTQDVVIAHHVFEHLENPVASIREIHRILRTGGYLILGTPDFASPCAKRFGDNYRMLHDPTHRSLFTLESMHRFLRDHGFTILDVKFPFPQRYATVENFMRWNDTSRVSPPWPGNHVTYYCQR